MFTNPNYAARDTSGTTCISAIRAALTPEEFVGFCKGSIIKYIWREQNKGKADDARKATDYADMLQLAIDAREFKKMENDDERD